MIFTYWNEKQLLAELKLIAIDGRNKLSMLALDIDLSRMGDDECRYVEAIDLAFQYLEAGLVEQMHYPLRYPCREGWESIGNYMFYNSGQ